jgi:hypothetical protein
MDVGRLWRSRGHGGVTQRSVWAEELRPSHYYDVDAALGYLLDYPCCKNDQYFIGPLYRSTRIDYIVVSWCLEPHKPPRECHDIKTIYKFLLYDVLMLREMNRVCNNFLSHSFTLRSNANPQHVFQKCRCKLLQNTLFAHVDPVLLFAPDYMND